MSIEHIQTLYNEDLKPLEKLLSNVRRPGNFFINGSKELPMPRVEIEGIGIISFPVPEEQIKKIIKQAIRAPHGRGAETILDTSVRKVWQLTPDKVKISDQSWETNFKSILDQIKNGLGCQDISVSAELYKLLVYDEGGFFLAHRDTEKSPGMFGTLVVVLPSVHRGGELVIRHAGREVIIDLSRSEISELAFAAFYADCEHEVRPITGGNRICLVYNLIQHHETTRKTKKQSLIEAPIYDTEIADAAKLLTKAFKKENSPTKIAWLLEHQYSPAELSFATLKNADAALAQVLSQAALQAHCAIHLGIVHLEESGSAEPHYESYSRHSKWGYDDEEEEEEEESFGEDFDVIDVCEQDQFIDGWVDFQNRSVDFGQLPLEEGELLPKGALDGETPDEQRLMEATGNEGASYERSYHRAALVIWHQNCYVEVLLQAGVGAAMTYFKERVDSGCSLKEGQSIATLILDHWEADPRSGNYLRKHKNPNRSEMLTLLRHLQDPSLLERFISNILVKEYDGTENAALAKAIHLLDPQQIESLLSGLIRVNMRLNFDGCTNMLSYLIDEESKKSSTITPNVIRKIATAIVITLKDIGQNPSSTNSENIWRERKAKSPESDFIVELWNTLMKLDVAKLEDTAAEEIVSHPSIFNPGTVLVPALKKLQRLHSSSSLIRLWQHAGNFLLERSEFPLQPPQDWRQKVTISCHCDDCKELQAFAENPKSQICRFRIKKERRQHIHQIIGRYEMDMTHITERTGSPQTLVCTKTRRKHELRVEQYQADIASMRVLVKLSSDISDKVLGLRNRLVAAIERC